MFGTAKPATTGFTGFGAGASTTPSFGFGTTPATTAATTGFQFNTPQAQTGFQLGAAQPNTGLQLGATQPANALGFNSTPTFNNVGFSGGSLSFGTPATTTTSSLFGTTTAPGLSFATPAITAPTGFGLGLGTTATSTAPSLAFSFGPTTSTTTPSTGFSFGNTAKTTSGQTLGGVAAPSFSFTSNTTTSAPTLGFGLGTTTSTPSQTLGGGLFGTSTAFGLSPATTTTTTVGLGGVDTTQSKLGLSGPGAAEPKHVKDNLLPDPLLQTFNDFQTFVKQQKSLSVDIARSSSKPVKKVQEDIEAMESMLANITNGLARNAVTSEKLKGETAQAICHVDMAQRLREAPAAVSYESGPEQYFLDLVSRFETDAARLQVQVEAAERHLRSVTQSSAISPQELTLAMRRLHETLVVLAARVQNLHSLTQSALDEYRHLRHVYFKEDIPLSQKPVSTMRRPAQRSLAGPTPFSESSGVATLSVDALSMLTGGAPTVPITSSTGWLGSQTVGAGLMTSPTSSFFQSPVDNSGGFQLSKPPVGNKRNKR